MTTASLQVQMYKTVNNDQYCTKVVELYIFTQYNIYIEISTIESKCQVGGNYVSNDEREPGKLLTSVEEKLYQLFQK